MKKIALLTTIIILLSLLIAGSAFAQAQSMVAKGTVAALTGNSITVESIKDGTLTVTLPDGFDPATLKVGDVVMVKGVVQEDGSLLATTVRPLGKGQGRANGQGNGKPEDAGKANSAFCAADKQDKDHPLAATIAEKYGVSPDWVMGYYCDGQSMGAIMLALKTGQINGADPASLLAQRASGEGWGNIWQDMGLIGSEKDVKTPPGQLKK